MNNSKMQLKFIKWKKEFKETIVHAVLLILVVVWLFPILWIVLTSFRAGKGSYSPEFIPSEYTFDNYMRLFTDTQILDFPQMFINTLIVSVFTCLISTFFILSVSYALSRLRFKMRKKYLNIALILGMFPGFMTMIAIYYILKICGLTQGELVRVALILAYSGGAGLGFYIMKGFFDTIPKALDEAARIDGANKWQVFTRITIPLSKPLIVYTLLTAFLGPWLDFLMAKVIVGSQKDYFTVSVGLWNMLEKDYVDSWYTPFFAASVCVSIPTVILFICIQRYYAEGLSGAIKG